MKHYVYLAGPITGLTFDEGQDWRTKAAKAIDSYSIKCLSPLRGKEYLRSKGKLNSGTYEGTLTSQKAITRRDFFDCTRSTVLLINLADVERVSIGTVMEVAWAYQAGIPSIVVCPPGNLHRHVLFDECCTYQVDTLEEAIALVKLVIADVPNTEDRDVY